MTTDYRVCESGYPMAKGEEFIFSACFISLHPAKISFLRHPAALLRVYRCVFVSLFLLILSANIKPQVGGKKWAKSERVLSSSKNKDARAADIYLCSRYYYVCLPLYCANVYLYIYRRKTLLAVDKSQRVVQLSL